jgi:hypothetical protein
VTGSGFVSGASVPWNWISAPDNPDFGFATKGKYQRRRPTATAGTVLVSVVTRRRAEGFSGHSAVFRQSANATNAEWRRAPPESYGLCQGM